MKQQVSPALAAGIALTVLALLGGFLLLRSRQAPGEAEQVAVKGQQAGQKMMQSMQRTNGQP